MSRPRPLHGFAPGPVCSACRLPMAAYKGNCLAPLGYMRSPGQVRCYSFSRACLIDEKLRFAYTKAAIRLLDLPSSNPRWKGEALWDGGHGGIISCHVGKPFSSLRCALTRSVPFQFPTQRPNAFSACRPRFIPHFVLWSARPRKGSFTKFYQVSGDQPSGFTGLEH